MRSKKWDYDFLHFCRYNIHKRFPSGKNQQLNFKNKKQIYYLKLNYYKMQQKTLNELIQEAPDCQQVKKRWNKMSQVYLYIDSAPQTFFYTLTNMLQLEKAKNILEIACGAGKLIPQVLDLKSPQTFYYATDISNQMIKFSKLRLQNHFKKYKSTISLDQWMKEQNLELAELNGQGKIQKDFKFDRIICNLVLMLTKDPRKMLNNLWEHAQNGCLLGLTVWGDKYKNPFFGMVQDFSQQHNLLPANSRSNFYLYDKIQQLIEECGWEKVLSWEQIAILPAIQHSKQYVFPFIKQQILGRFPQELHEKFLQRINDLINVKKCGLPFNCKLMIARKKTK